MTMKYVLTFSVAPHRMGLHKIPPQFPLDMLRHDACFPDRLEDSDLMAVCLDSDATCRVRLGHACGGKLVIRLCSYRPDARSAPTRARWARYGWKVSGVKREQL